MDRGSELTYESQPFRRRASDKHFDWRTPALGLALALASWALGQVNSHSERLARLETSLAHSQQVLERIELKLDKLKQ